MTFALEIRLAGEDELSTLSSVERDAAERFRGLDLMQETLLEQTLPRPMLEEACRAGRLWVAARPGGALLGFAHALLIDGAPHLNELDVRPQYWGRGVGSRLVEYVARWAAEHGWSGLTLSTFRDPEWNAPFYARRGFRILEERELTPGLRELRRREADLGLRVERRVIMRRALERLPRICKT
ncbi:MAG TPA: GNAT family N-acetyltransferase [Myxococcota bacterium]|nr:GNAT family N-acetyltransferase [Myxococcota bacterium]